MKRKPPKLSPDASEQARAIHAFLGTQDFTMKAWLEKAGLSTNALTELFSGRSKGMIATNLQKLAAAAGVSPSDIVGGKQWAHLAGGEFVDLRTVRRAVALWSAARGRPDPEADAHDIEAVIISALDAADRTPRG